MSGKITGGQGWYAYAVRYAGNDLDTGVVENYMTVQPEGDRRFIEQDAAAELLLDSYADDIELDGRAIGDRDSLELLILPIDEVVEDWSKFNHGELEQKVAVSWRCEGHDAWHAAGLYRGDYEVSGHLTGRGLTKIIRRS